MKPSFESPSQCVAVGWPWHGPIKRTGAEYSVQLPAGRSVQIKDFGSVDTVLWDIGKPDLVSEAVALAGGAWWGKAILRYGAAAYEDLAGAQFFYYGSSRLKLDGVPLYRAPYDEELGRVFVCSMLLQSGALHVAAAYEGRQINVVVPLTDAQLGQGAGQPELAASNGSFASSDSTMRMITDTEPGQYFSAILDAKGCKVLLGVIARTSTLNTVIAPSQPATSKYGPATYAALLEVELVADFFEDNGVPGVIVRLVEDRRSALGDPSLTLDDETIEGLRTRIETWTQTSYLVTAWYTSSGAVASIRCSRVQESKFTRELRTEAGLPVEEQVAQRTTTLKMERGGFEFDEVVLLDRLQVVQTDGATLRVIRTIELTDEPDDIADSGVFSTTGVSWPDPPAVYGPGVHRVDTAVTYIYLVGGLGSESLIPEQDLRAVWVCGLSNKLGGICTAVEPYDYEPGAASYVTQCHYRPAAHPSGIDGRSLRASEVHLGAGATRFTRSFYYFAAGATGSYNPVTGDVLRGNAINRESWV
ncbi:hypothetical protein [Pseudomonas leptonychotis]|uniref:hypothetical protein n=1 Tax=Pseudomonas leptonychotis TaxID=2448482 RepID=UPI00386CC8C7